MQKPLDSGAPGSLVDEALIFSRYLSGREADPEVIDRYTRACAMLLPEETGHAEMAVLIFARRHGWSLPFLDAATSLVSPDSILRGRLVLMLSILETTPRHAGLFTARARNRAVFFFMLAVRGLSAGVKTAGGLLLMPVARLTMARRSS